MTIRYGSVCSGIEAATMGWHGLGWQPVFFSEIEKFPSAVLAHHYGSNMPGEPLSKNGIPNYGDFTQIPEDAGPVDLLVGGTPCQSFSVAGKRLGLDDPRGNLALEYLALARRLRARWIVWENVPGVVSSVTDEEDGEGGVQPALEGREAGDEWTEESDFATFLEHVLECGYGFSYRVLDAQYVRVDGHARAVPQRRRRVFVVGYLGDWRRAAAVLLEPEGMRGDPAPRREAGQGVAGAVNASAGRRGGIDDPERGKLISEAFGGGNTSGAINVSTALTAHGQRQDFEVETFIAEIAGTLNAGGNVTGGERQPGTTADTADTMLVAQCVAPPITRNHYADNESRDGLLVAHSVRAEGFDASEDGTGRGTPIVPVCFDTTQITSSANYSQPKPGDPSHPLSAQAHPPAIAYSLQAGALRENPDAGPDGVGVQEGHAYTLEARAEVQAVAFAQNCRDEVRLFGGDGQTVGALAAEPGMKQTTYVAHQWAVRRLTPRECERLQGFPDDFTNVPWNGKPEAADGPRYKALGNSMAVNVMRWIGERIDIMERLIQEGRV